MTLLERYAENGDVERMENLVRGWYELGRDVEPFKEVLITGYKNTIQAEVKAFNELSRHFIDKDADFASGIPGPWEKYMALTNGSTVADILQKT